MSRKNVKVVRSLFAAFQVHEPERGRQRAVGYVDPAVEWRENEKGGFPGLRRLYQGDDGLREWSKQVKELWEELRPEPEDYIDLEPDRLVCAYRLHGRGRGSDVPVVSPTVYDVYTIINGKVVLRELYGSRTDMMEAVGLRE